MPGKESTRKGFKLVVCLPPKLVGRARKEAVVILTGSRRVQRASAPHFAGDPLCHIPNTLSADNLLALFVRKSRASTMELSLTPVTYTSDEYGMCSRGLAGQTRLLGGRDGLRATVPPFSDASYCQPILLVIGMPKHRHRLTDAHS